MPCVLPSDDAIPIGRYGTSNVGRAKTVYRTGLSHRYGRRMQTISGIHYNFSLPGVSNDGYFSLIRNFRRQSWLLLYLFGASPAVCSCFVAGRDHDLEELKPGVLYRPYATSLRMGRLGYQSDAQASLAVSYNCLDSYAHSLQGAMTRPYPLYEGIGLKDGNGYRQLATTLLQIENEFYGTIRPKRVIHPGERPLHALRERGVEYVEVRLMDLNPFLAIGIGAETMRLLDVFLLHCLLSDSPPDTPEEIKALGRNQQCAAGRGREPGLLLERSAKKVALVDWGREILAECGPIAAELDRVHGGSAYREALGNAVTAIGDPSSVPSAQVLSDMAANHDNSYVRFALAHSARNKEKLAELPLPKEIEQKFAKLAAVSLEEQAAMEAGDHVPFEVFRQEYLSAERLGVGSADCEAAA